MAEKKKAAAAARAPRAKAPAARAAAGEAAPKKRAAKAPRGGDISGDDTAQLVRDAKGSVHAAGTATVPVVDAAGQ